MGTRAWPNLGCLQYALNRGESQYWEKSIKFRKRYLIIGHTGRIKPFARGTTKLPGPGTLIRLQKRFLLPRLGRCAFAGLATWLSSDRLAEKTITRAEVGEQLIHALPEENFRAAARSL